MAKSIIVFNSGNANYRRANIAFNKGENILDAEKVTSAQLDILNADPRLVVQSGDASTDTNELSALVENPADNKSDELNAGINISVAKAIHDLKQAGKLELTQSGKPEIACLEAELPDFKISAAERDAAWALYQETSEYVADKDEQ